MAYAEIRSGAPQHTPTPVIFFAILVMVGVFALLLFLPAGRLDWPLAWVYVGIVLVYVALNWALLHHYNPELIDRRMHFGKGTKKWDKVWAVLFAPIMYAVYVVAGLEARDGLMSMPIAVWPLGFALFVPGSALLTWSMVINPFFEKTVRIQEDRGHRVIDTGPYTYVRHPGYAGFLLWILGTPFMLGSAWAIIPAMLAVVGIVIRTALEDRTLTAELDGYQEYAARVRYRLLPSVW